MAEQVRLAQVWRPDAVVIACFGDPGLDAAREATSFSVVTTLSRTCITAERLLQRCGFERHCRGVHGTNIPVLDFEHASEACTSRIEQAAREVLAHDKSGAIVLGCTGMAPLCAELSQRLGVPVIDGVAVKLAESLVVLKLRTSQVGDYAPSPPKPYADWAHDLNW